LIFTALSIARGPHAFVALPQLVEFSKSFGISAEPKNITGSDFPQERRKDAVLAVFR
jgi:hypothetical protein